MAFKFDPGQPTAVADWTNYSGSIGKHSIPHFCVVPGDPNKVPNPLELHGAAVNEILELCFSGPDPLQLRTLGSTWSFSSVITPNQVVLNPGNMYVIEGIPHQHWTAPYLARAQQGFRPIFVEGGAGIGTLNQKLGEGQYALQTSGAGNGHRMGGCIATGTHGSALRIGALHDTVLAMYLLVAPNKAVLVQSGKSPPFLPTIAGWLQEQTKIPTTIVADDTAIAAARVGLGSIGFVFGAIVEATDLYCFRIHRVACNAEDPAVLNAMKTLNTAALHPQDAPDAPYHFDVVMNPYPVAGKKEWFVTLMWKRSAAGRPFSGPLQGIPRTTTDTMGLISSLVDIFGDGITQPLTRAIVADQIHGQLSNDAKPADEVLFPGQVFGPTTLPKGRGASTEIVVDHTRALDTLDALHEVLHEQAQIGNFLLGCVAMRFVPKTRSLLGMNQADMSCFIELPSIASDGVRAIYKALWQKLDDEQINFACHWGQLGGFSEERTKRYYGQHAVDWRNARRDLLQNSDTALHVFASKILTEAGLG